VLAADTPVANGNSDSKLVLAGVIALCMTLVEIIKSLIKKYIIKEDRDKITATLTDAEKEAIHASKRNLEEQLVRCKECTKVLITLNNIIDKEWELLGRTDTEGIPMIYAPRRWADIYKEIIEQQRELAETMQTISGTQKEIAHTQEAICAELKKWSG
jgi:hypothetical protein